MFKSFHYLYLAKVTFVGSVICLQDFIYSTLQCLHLLVLGLCQQVLIYSTLQCLYLLGLWYDHRFHLLYFAMFTFVGCVVMLKGFYILYLATFILVGSVIRSQVSFTLPCNVYICMVWHMFTSFHLLYLAMFTFVGSVICLQVFIYSTLQCLHLLGL